ncbi:hypothetical protein [Limnovirga soli]|uniref:Uncharacterized protein n=1 Tax=Limnovirga soli TaxID=2656915 RepID=A0A8J8FJV1_9BACT|nr:hypothetical protein [Limnovirga soli]NNV57196.1 hypothetical protein [Limnovirga soli]
MSIQELTDRFISDVDNVILAKSVARSLEQIRYERKLYANDIKTKLTVSLDESNISMDYEIILPYSLGDIGNFLNHNEKVFKVETDGKVIITNFAAEIKANKLCITNTIQKLKDSPNLIVYFGDSQLTQFDYLIDKFEQLHDQSVVLLKCYQRINENKTIA